MVAYECLAGHVPFTAREPLAIAYAHKHEPVPALPPDVPAPVADLVYDMLAKTPAERPASARVVADRADMLREALALGDSAPGGEFAGADFAGVTRADLPAGPAGPLLEGYDSPGRPGPAPPGRRRWAMAGLTAVLCALAAVAGPVSQRSSARPDQRRHRQQHGAAHQLVGRDSIAAQQSSRHGQPNS